jgi:hypothetical protein
VGGRAAPEAALVAALGAKDSDRAKALRKLLSTDASSFR